MAPGKLAVEHLSRDSCIDAIAHLRKQQRKRNDFHALRTLIASERAPKREHAIRTRGNDATRAAGRDLLDKFSLEQAAPRRSIGFVLQDLAAAKKRDAIDLSR